MAAKADDAFKTISEAAEQLELPQHVLRHWEESFGNIRPMRRAGGRRYYRKQDLELLSGVKTLLHDQRYTTKGVQKIFKENGAAFVAEIGRKAMLGETVELRPQPTDDAENKNVGFAPDNKIPPAQDLKSIIERLEKVQDRMDEALLAIESIKAMGLEKEE